MVKKEMPHLLPQCCECDPMQLSITNIWSQANVTLIINEQMHAQA